jgi:hypothetical protein
MATEKSLTETTASLGRIQQFDVKELERSNSLGITFSFVDAVKPAQDVVDLYKRIPITALSDFTDEQLNSIKGQANADFQIFDTILKFDPKTDGTAQRRQGIINQVQGRRDAVFKELWQYIAYGVARLTDTSSLEVQARATIQGIKDAARVLTDQLALDQGAAEKALKAIRDVAVEQGVSQQAAYFKGEAGDQEDSAKAWLMRTYQFAGGLGAVAVGGLFLHRWEWLAPKTSIEVFQFVASKFLIFALLGFMLIMAARNYASHKHNAVVNRHRQNALLTYQKLVAAAGEQGTEDIVLAHAAACIFSPQATGYSVANSEGFGGSKSVLELMTKGASKSAE